ncbi:MAG: hypothetical protein AAF658_17120, partial [Myxococcota bacterium]
MRSFAVFCGLLALTPTPAWAQLSLVDDPVVGRVQFIYRGGSLVDNAGVENGVNCLEDSGTTAVSEADLPSRPTLVRAILTVSGSLFGDDGPDFVSPDQSLLVTPDLNADDPTDRPFVEAAARADADRNVLFSFPGATAPVEVSATSSTVVAYNRPDAAETPGNVAFFTTRFDVTDLLRDQPTLAGTYPVREPTADVCFGQEASCSAGETCGAISQVHSNALASFSLLLVVESVSLPLRTVAAFEGLNLLATSTTDTLILDTPNPFSDPAAGRLAFYALEGDLPIAEFAGTTPPCSSLEYIEVDGDMDPNNDGLCLSDDDNPVGNLFNSTINVLPE